MADLATTPVATQIQPPAPIGQTLNNALSPLSSILGIQQQQKNLQTTALQQQLLQAQGQQAQQTAQQRAAVAQWIQQVDPSEHMADDGTLDLGSLLSGPNGKSLAAAAGDSYPDVVKSLLDAKAAQIGAKQGLATLNGTLRGQFDSVIGSFTNDPDVQADNGVGRQKVLASISAWARAGGPDAQRIASVYQNMVAHAPQGHLDTMLRSIQLQTESASAQASTQQPSYTQVPTGAEVKTYQTNPYGPSPQAPPASLPQTQIYEAPGGGPLVAVKGGQTVTQLTQPGASGASATPQSNLPPLRQPGLNDPAGRASYNAQIAAATKEYQEVSAGANDPMNGVQATRFRNQQILDLIPHATTGPGLRLLNTLASRIPGSSGDAYQDLEHYTAQNSAALAARMGVPNTNLGAETAAAAAGNVERNPGALAEITKTNDALNTAADLYNRGLARVTGNGSDMSRVASYKQAFGANFDVNALRWADAYRRGDQQEIASLRQRYGAGGIARFQKELATLKSLATTGNLPQQ